VAVWYDKEWHVGKIIEGDENDNGCLKIRQFQLYILCYIFSNYGYLYINMKYEKKNQSTDHQGLSTVY
jgi:hypothetical protein